MMQDLYSNLSDSILAGVALALAMTAIVGTLFTVLNGMKRSRLESKKLLMEIEIMRHSLEGHVYDLNERISADSDRWKDVNRLVLEGNTAPSSGSSERVSPNTKIGERQFLRDLGINADNIVTERNKVFILTPFHERFDETYNALRSVAIDLGLRPSRGDELYSQSSVLSHILSEILSSSLVIANLDGRNPNVFYELGLAHALGKKVILVTSSLDEMPFDLRNQRLVFWRDETELKNELTKSIARYGLNNQG